MHCTPEHLQTIVSFVQQEAFATQQPYKILSNGHVLKHSIVSMVQWILCLVQLEHIVLKQVQQVWMNVMIVLLVIFVLERLLSTTFVLQQLFVH